MAAATQPRPSHRSRKNADAFFRDALAIDPHGEIGATDLYAAYIRWFNQQGPVEFGDVLLTTAAFGREATRYGIHKRRHARGNVYFGICIRPEAADGSA